MKLDEHTHALLNLLLYGIIFKREQLPHDEAKRIFEHFVLPELVAKKLNKSDVQQTLKAAITASGWKQESIVARGAFWTEETIRDYLKALLHHVDTF